MQSEVGLAEGPATNDGSAARSEGRERAGRPWWRRRVLWMAAGVTVLVAAGGVAYVAWPGGSGAVTTISGSVAIEGPSNLGVFTFTENPAQCSGAGEFAGLTEGGGVTVRDGKGAVVGRGRLGHGQPLDISDAGFGNIHIADRCLFLFTVRDVPRHDRYTIEVPGGGRATVTAAQVAAKDVSLRVGG